VNVEHLPVLCNVSGSDANLSHTHEFTNKNFDQCHRNVLGDLVLPKFSDCRKQNVVHFLAVRRVFRSEERARIAETTFGNEGSYRLLNQTMVYRHL
jgi:hypothetical protein